MQATKKATRQLQKVYDFLDHQGGTIITDRPDYWWNLALELEETMDGNREARIGVFRDLNGDIVFDPVFYLALRMDGDRITEADIEMYMSQAGFMDLLIDRNDRVITGFPGEKDEHGLRRRFSAFMDNITGAGPYLESGRVQR